MNPRDHHSKKQYKHSSNRSDKRNISMPLTIPFKQMIVVPLEIRLKVLRRVSEFCKKGDLELVLVKIWKIAKSLASSTSTSTYN